MLVQLAELVLSFVPNSASVERLFSSMGDTKSKKRTRLGVQKNRDISFLKMELRRQHAIDGTAKRRLHNAGKEDCGIVQPANVISTSHGLNEADVSPAYAIRQCNEYAKLGSWVSLSSTVRETVALQAGGYV